MKEDIGNLPFIVIVGSWNRAIFNPEWVRKKLFNQEEMNVAISINNIFDQIKFESNKISMILNDNRITLTMKDYTEDTCQFTIKIIRNLARILSVTPVLAFGINFKFISNKNNKLLNEDYDLKYLTENIGINISNSFSRKLRITDTNSLNITISKEQNNTISYNYNFDYKVSAMNQISQLFGEDDVISKLKDKVLSIQEKCYNEKLE